MNSARKIALITGVLFLITFITSIPAAFVFYAPVLDDPRYIVGATGADTSVLLGAFLELLLIISNIGTALVPRGMAMLGLIGGPLVCASGIAILFGVFEAGSVWQAIATIPEFLWELSLGIWLTVRGFNPSALARLQPESQ